MTNNLSVRKSGALVVYMHNYRKEGRRFGHSAAAGEQGRNQSEENRIAGGDGEQGGASDQDATGGDNTVQEDNGPIWPVSLLEDRVKNFLSFVIDNPAEFKTMRRRGRVEEYLIFLDLVLYHFVPANEWKKRGHKGKVRDLFTISDEAMAMVLLENNALDMLNYINQGNGTGVRVVPSRRNSKTKYTKSDGREVQGGGKSNFQGWSLAGTRRYNELFQEVASSRMVTEALDNNILEKYRNMFPRDDDDDDDMDESAMESNVSGEGEEEIAYEHICTGYDLAGAVPNQIEMNS